MNNIASISSWNTVSLQRDAGKEPDLLVLVLLKIVPKQSLTEKKHQCVVNQNSVMLPYCIVLY
jgi:hypothetical protein